MFSRSTIFAIIAIIIANIEYNGIAKYSQDAVLSHRLGPNVLPLHYNISINTDLKSLNFFGHVEIDVLITKSANQITLHSNLSISKVELFDSNNNQLVVDWFETNTATELTTIYLKQYISKQAMKIKIDYRNKLNEDTTVGFFADSYSNTQGQVKWYAFTYCEPIYARKIFPCFDEPSFKATFVLNLGRPRQYISMANMPLSHTWQKENYSVDVYEKSPNMSTYQVAFGICDFSNVTEFGIFRIFTLSNIITDGLTDFLLQINAKIFEALQYYTEITYGLNKLDQVAIPFFPYHIMSNWGLIGYSEDAVFSFNESRIKDKEEILKTVTRGFVLQWFGNLVSPRWWNYLWLKEGFASYLSYKIAHKVRPAWRMEDQYLMTVQCTFELDTNTNIPLSVDAENLFEIDEEYNTALFDKAGAVLRMLDYALPNDLFRDGVVIYLKKRSQYGVAKPSDLWNAIQGNATIKVNKVTIDIPKIMKTWESQSGFPVILIDRDYEKGVLGIVQETKVTQRTYFQELHSFAKPEREKMWHIPLNWATKDNLHFSNTEAIVWLKPRGTQGVNFYVSNEAWLIANIQATGYYRVNYDDRNWMLIANYLNTTDYYKIHLLNRAQLIDDAFHLGSSNHLNFSIVLNLTKYLHRETDYIVHRTFFRNLEYFNKMACWAPLYNLFEQYVATLLERSLVKLGYVEVSSTDEELINNLHRRDVIYWACRMNNTACRTNTIPKLHDISNVAENLRTSIVCGGLRGANQSMFEKVETSYLYYRGFINYVKLQMGCSENHTILLEYVEREMGRTNILNVFYAIYSKSKVGTEFVFYYILGHFNELHKEFGDDVGDLIVSLSELLSTREHLFWFLDLRRRATTHSLMFSFDKAIETIERNNNWAVTYYEDITSWIKTEL